MINGQLKHTMPTTGFLSIVNSRFGGALYGTQSDRPWCGVSMLLWGGHVHRPGVRSFSSGIILLCWVRKVQKIGCYWIDPITSWLIYIPLMPIQRYNSIHLDSFKYLSHRRFTGNNNQVLLILESEPDEGSLSLIEYDDWWIWCEINNG